MTDKGYTIKNWLIQQIQAMDEGIFEAWFDKMMLQYTMDELSRVLRERKSH